MASDRVKQARLKVARYCAMAERSPRQVIDKLEKYGLSGHEAEKVFIALKSEKFVDEERFAGAFVNDKFTFNQWGRNRLKQELKLHDIPGEIIENAIYSIPDEEYTETVSALLEKKWAKIRDDEHFLSRKKKTIDYLLRKGFEGSVVFSCFEEFMSRRKQS